MDGSTTVAARRTGTATRGAALGPLGPGMAAILSAAAVAGALGAARPFSPDPAHPRTARWYRRLDKPASRPPDAAMPLIWGVLDLLQFYAGYRLLQAPRSAPRGRAVGLWLFNLLMQPVWSAVFFGRKRLGASVAAVLPELAGAALFVRTARRVDGTAAAAGAPLAAWLAIATVLDIAIWRRNR